MKICRYQQMRARMFGCVMHPGRAALLARHSGAVIILIGFFMVCSKARPIFWMRGLILAVAGFGGVVIWPSLSSAQYPGSAGDLNVGAFSGSSSASSGSSSGVVLPAGLPVVLRARLMLVLARVLPATLALGQGLLPAGSLQMAGIVMRHRRPPGCRAKTPRENAR